MNWFLWHEFSGKLLPQSACPLCNERDSQEETRIGDLFAENRRAPLIQKASVSPCAKFPRRASLFLPEQVLNLLAHEGAALGPFPAQFAGPAPPGDTFLVDKVNRRPIGIAIVLPHGAFVVHGHGMIQPGLF